MPHDTRPPAIFLMGPTATGKTDLACALAERYPVQLVSVDSALVYRGFDIGTAKPGPALLARHPHRLIDIREATDPYSAADFRADALAVMDQIAAAGGVPLLVGGTGLYFRALERGLSALPAADAAIRSQLAAEAAREGWPALHARLAAADPHAAARIGSADAQRIQRALEVFALTGRALSAQQAIAAAPGRPPFKLLKIALVPPARDFLHRRIERRFDAMLDAGFIDEARRLHAAFGAAPDLPAMRAVGYRQAFDHLEGHIDLPTFRERAVSATRQLAKRQLTWLRRELDARVFDPEANTLRDDVTRALADFLSNGAPIRT